LSFQAYFILGALPKYPSFIQSSKLCIASFFKVFGCVKVL